MQFSAELEGVAAGGVGNMIDELHDGVGALELWPFKATQARKEISAKPDARQSAREWTRDAGVEPVAGCGRVEIARQCRLVKAVISKARLIHPMRIGSPRPASANHLSPRVNLRPPLRLQLRKVFDRPCVVPEEVHAANAVILVDVEIHFAERVVNGDVVGESIRDVDVWIIVRGETSPVACTRERATGNQKTGWADAGTPWLLQVRNHVNNAVRAVTGLGTEEAVWSRHSVHDGRGHRDHRRAGDAPERVSYAIDLPLVSPKEKDLVFDNRAADAAAVLLQRSCEFGVGYGVEKVSRVHYAVATKREPGAVNLVCAGLETHVNHRPRFPPEFGRCKFFHIEFLNRVDGQNRRRIASDTGAVDDGLARVGLAVEQALNEVGVV